MTWTEFNMPPCLRGGRPFGSVEVVLVVLGWVGTWSCHHQLMSDEEGRSQAGAVELKTGKELWYLFIKKTL